MPKRSYLSRTDLSRCEGRVRDPFGHLWIVSHVTEDVTDDEIRQRIRSAYGVLLTRDHSRSWVTIGTWL